METIWDWVTVFIFAGLVTLFLSRSVDVEHDDDRLFHYLVPSAGCAVANWLGNEGHGLAAALLILLVLGYVRHFLFRRPHQPPAP
ncbi:XrtV sorting system accessory protein [Sphingomonas sp. LHG3406-1]|uniref:XrtV sorting system accessory protein n=1 Tax=Sphingomonas sp. LHG3406-1 TaxID=2804617 RepID=UPI002625D94F|nr:XrtV sorting system accessory protein [Sphingomonas sp. LHG3406-1]